MTCKNGAISLIDTIIDTISSIDDRLFYQSLDIYNGSSFGKHFRHIHDFFHCIIEQVNNPQLDYCDRCRDSHIENDKLNSIASFEALKRDISILNEEQIMTVKADFELENGERPEVKTSIGREIMYAYDHAVHHLAIVKIGLNKHCPELDINQNLGVAASTIRHQNH